MTFGGICITTTDAPRLAEFYKVVFQKEPFIEGEHYAFGSVAVYNPGDVTVPDEKNIWLQCFAEDLDAEYQRLLRDLPGVEIISPPERRPWGAYSFWFKDPDGNSIAVAENNLQKAGI
jgi:predicted enzyme related to lactoylglutathione lyase